jgi:hypothetical protein
MEEWTNNNYGLSILLGITASFLLMAVFNYFYSKAHPNDEIHRDFRDKFDDEDY